MIFVFGSNTAGIHGAGAAADARKSHGAILGIGEGRVGNSYAIPTKTGDFQTRPLDKILESVLRFVEYAIEHDDEEFEVTRIGCGLAGYIDEDIAPLFKGAPQNCVLPRGWRDYNEGKEVKFPQPESRRRL
jgi:hypothetical protein